MSNTEANTSVPEAQDDDFTVQVEVLETTGFTTSDLDGCICSAGMFYHWRTHECLEKGGEGYECGFFPAEQHDSVCKPGFHCEKTVADSAYRAHNGAEGESYPAACMPCDEEHPCEAGAEEECLTEYNVTGETCFSVRVEIALNPIQEAIDSFDLDSVTGGSSSQISEVLLANNPQVQLRAGGAKAMSASGAPIGNSTKSVCILVADAKLFLQITPETKVDESLAEKIVAAGQLLAFEQAFLAARAEAVDRGMLAVDGLMDDLADEHDRAVEGISQHNVTEKSEEDDSSKTSGGTGTRQGAGGTEDPEQKPVDKPDVSDKPKEVEQSTSPPPSVEGAAPPSVEGTAKALRGGGVDDTYDAGTPGLKRKVETAHR